MDSLSWHLVVPVLWFTEKNLFLSIYETLSDHNVMYLPSVKKGVVRVSKGGQSSLAAIEQCGNQVHVCFFAMEGCECTKPVRLLWPGTLEEWRR